MIHCRPFKLRPCPQVVHARATIDFETRSAADLKKVGPWLYARHPSTQILCLAYHLPGMDPAKPKLWHRAHPLMGIAESPMPVDLFNWIALGGKIEAHNVGFEFNIWKHVCVARMGWPAIADDQWICSAAKCAAIALPRSLEGAIEALGLPIKKDSRGKELLRKLSKPAKLRKIERLLYGADFVLYREDPEDLEDYRALWRYCQRDVYAEVMLSNAVPDLSPDELELWQITEAMNRRGVLIDVELCRAALYLTTVAKAELNAELFEICGIQSGSQRGAVLTWLRTVEKIKIDDTKAATVDWWLTRNRAALTERAARVLEIVKEVNRTSSAKYARMLQGVDTDNRARDILAYCGAERTGRFAGRGIQVHNLPKGRFAKHLPKATAIDIAVEDIKSRDYEWCKAIHGDVMNLLASCLRGCIIAPKGRYLMTADYSAIEARCILWEAGADKALVVFREGGDIYCDMASGIFGRLITKDTAKPINDMGATERDFGKVAVLGLGYGMGHFKFLITLRAYNIVLTRAEVLGMMGEKRFAKYEKIVRDKLFPHPDQFTDLRHYKQAKIEAGKALRTLRQAREVPEEVIHELALCKYTVDTYRKRYAEVPEMWKAQEAAAIQAVENPRTRVECGPVTWYMSGRFLKCELPSGRCLHYADARVIPAKTSWGEVRKQLRFMGRNQTTGRWEEQGTYGGKLCENITQAIARDVMGYAKRTLARDPIYDLLMSVHDEIIAEADEGTGNVKAFEHAMAILPPAYDGCPIAAEGKALFRYRK